ncbi:hypothetical protein J6590_011194 [Homalodisca vitripennis]|nr:hypothetical protein J6590_011194 [Homalodisca vitripennis]
MKSVDRSSIETLIASTGVSQRYCCVCGGRGGEGYEKDQVVTVCGDDGNSPIDGCYREGSLIGLQKGGEIRAKKPSFTQPGDQRFKTTSNGRAGGLLGRTGSLSGHPSKQQPRSTLLDPVILR